MATVTRTYLVDDLDGTEGGVETVRFSIDKDEYEIDLAPENSARMRDNLERFVRAGHELRQSKRVVRKQVISGAVSKEQTQAIRHWARENGLPVSERGRIPANVREAFEAAH
ncbi:MAG TPA: Lsr2 family protein [Nakamurella sp.]